MSIDANDANDANRAPQSPPPGWWHDPAVTLPPVDGIGELSGEQRVLVDHPDYAHCAIDAYYCRGKGGYWVSGSHATPVAHPVLGWRPTGPPGERPGRLYRAMAASARVLGCIRTRKTLGYHFAQLGYHCNLCDHVWPRAAHPAGYLSVRMRRQDGCPGCGADGSHVRHTRGRWLRQVIKRPLRAPRVEYLAFIEGADHSPFN